MCQIIQNYSKYFCKKAVFHKFYLSIVEYSVPSKSYPDQFIETRVINWYMKYACNLEKIAWVLTIFCWISSLIWYWSSVLSLDDSIRLFEIACLGMSAGLK